MEQKTFSIPLILTTFTFSAVLGLYDDVGMFGIWFVIGGLIGFFADVDAIDILVKELVIGISFILCLNLSFYFFLNLEIVESFDLPYVLTAFYQSLIDLVFIFIGSFITIVVSKEIGPQKNQVP